jgi:DNA-binding Lrp family transcriptional regulator
MTSAYIFMKVGPEASFDLLPAIREIKGVQQAHAIMGPIDGVAFVEVKDLEGLSETVMAIRAVPGVESTDTRYAWPY